ncbi:MAG: HD domain-containing protein [Lachnospiraceae bacterium]|nr:HD domain-containing protein [Lachnospiraceae bacterium]
MAITTFAAIDIGSYDLEMKIFEMSGKGGMKQVDDIRYRLDLGSDTYAEGKVSYEAVNELCGILKEFQNIMRSYKVSDYKAYGTSAVRETKNTKILLDQIRQRTGIRIDVLSNSEQRFMDYKSIASRTEDFDKIMEKGTAIVDIGGGSIQISLFEKGSLISTQNMRLGVLRLQERLTHLDAASSKVEGLIDEIATAQLSVFKKMYLKDCRIENIIVVDDYLSVILQNPAITGERPGMIDADQYMSFLESVQSRTLLEIAGTLNIPRENALLLFISAVLVKRIVKMMDASLLWVPGVTLCDGIAYEYAEQHKIFKVEHDFERDILSSAENISKRYMGSKKRGETLERIALTIFDSMKRIHGLGKRERLLLQLAARLHDCGKYISMVNLGECSYNIIMSTEIIGLSHKEREIVANVVKYNHLPFVYYYNADGRSLLDEDAYLVVAKLTALLRVANGLDRSHKQKFKDVKTVVKDGQLVIQVDTAADITLERGLFTRRADFFEEVYSIRPVIRQKKSF